MNNIFDINRFGAFLKRKWLEFGKVYLLTIVLAGLAIAILYVSLISTGGPVNNYNHADGWVNLEFRYPMFLIFGFLYATITASTYFADMGEKARAIFQIMTPVSQFEKWLTGIIFAVIVPVISYVVLFNVVDMLMVKYLDNAVANQMVRNIAGQMVQLRFKTFYQSLDQVKGWQWLADFPFLFASLFLLGSIYFNRFHYVKTLATLNLFAIVGGYLFYLSATHFFGQKIYIGANPASWLDFHRTEVLFPAVLCCSVLLNIAVCYITYIRLQEKEV